MELIFDIGMNNGDDTAYYLHKGYKVVAVDADPAMVEEAKLRFREEIERDRVQILNVGIAPERGEQEFYISLQYSVWSSFDKANATKGGGEYRSLKVHCIRFIDLIDQFGIPYYVKIDIEGNDRCCLEDLESGRLPRFISFEMSYADSDKDIDLLSDLGYSHFKCIRQNDFSPITLKNMDRECSRREIVDRLGLVGKVINKIRFRKPRDGIWRFQDGSSGMFGDDLPGEWLSRNEARAMWRKLHDTDLRVSAPGLGEWFDIHACLRA